MIKRSNLKTIIDNDTFKISRSGIDPRKATNLLSGAGIDYLPEENSEVYYIQIGNNPDDLLVIALNDGVTKEVDKGEIKIYSVLSGVIQSYVHLKNDGNMILNGDDDNAVRFSNLKETIDELQNDITTLKAAFSSWVTVPEDGGAALKTAVTTWYGTALQKPIDSAKIDNIKVPGVTTV